IMPRAILARIWHDQARFLELLASPLRAAVDLRAVADVEDVDHAAVLVDPVDDAIGAPPGAITSDQWPKQRFADPVRIFRQGGRTDLQPSRGHGLWQLLCDSAPRGNLEPDLVPSARLGRHAPVTRRRARSWRTAARSAPGSPRSSADRLSEMRVTASASPRISRVISRPSRSSTDSRTASG